MAQSSSQPHSVPRQHASRHSSFGTYDPRAARTQTRATFPSSRMSQMELPERFKSKEEDDYDDTEDGTGVGHDDLPFIQQSIYGMLAATQTKANFPSRFQQDSGSDSEVELEASKKRDGSGTSSTRTTVDARKTGDSTEARKSQRERMEHRRLLSDHRGKLVRSFMKPAREQTGSQTQDHMTQSQILSPLPRQHTQITTTHASRESAPILNRKLQAMVRVAVESSTPSFSGRASRESEDKSSDSLRPSGSRSLTQVIADIFKFDRPEEVRAEYPCWYLQNVLLQGFMYITEGHICFYSYLQKKTNTILKRGHLRKQARHSYKYSRYWFVLKGDIFSYYKDSAEPYFPIGVVDLRYAISADISRPKAPGEEAADFTITASDRTYSYRAESPASAREWVQHLQKVIFRSHNDSDSVKISLPIEGILDIEQTSVVDFAETFKLRVMADDETFAVDEYFFTFFSSEENTLEALEHLENARGERLFRAADEATQIEGEGRVSSSDRGRVLIRTASQHSTSKSSAPPRTEESTESFVTTSELGISSSVDEAFHDNNMSASQMLAGDGVFRGPTLNRAGTTVDFCRDDPEQTSRESSSERVVHRPLTQHRVDQARSKGHPRSRPHSPNDSSQSTRQEDATVQIADKPASGRLVRGISGSMQHARTVAGMVRSSGKRMSSYLSSSPKTYIDNWSAAIAGGKRHYTGVEGLDPDDSIREPEQDMDVAEHERRFQEHFGLPQTETLLSVFYCWLHKTVPLYGKIYMGTRHFCFRSLWYGTKTKLVIPYKDIINVQKQRGFRWGYPGMVLVIRGYEELFFDFPSLDLRDDAVVTVLRSLETLGVAAQSTVLTQEEQQDADNAAAENELLVAARKSGLADRDFRLPHNVHQIAPDTAPILFEESSASVLDFKPSKSLRITCLTIGSRGDVQPYIALCKGLQAEGHICKIATHLEFKDWVEQHGIEFAEVTGDPAELMRVCVENGMFTPSFFLEVNSTFRVWLDELLQTAWHACKGADLLIESPSAMCGIHIAEALEIPYFRAFTMPWTRTRAYPHAFAVPNSKRGGGYNYMTYTFFDNIFWQAIAGQINRWRGKTLGLEPTSLDKLQQNKVPFLYNFSPNVVVPPLDFSDWIKITGYWFLDEGEEWEPPEDLAEFIKKARDANRKLVYIGFGSVTVSDSRQVMQQVIDAVVKADVHCILAKGWSDRYDKKDAADTPITLPPSIHQIRSAPHDWLFRQVDAVVHHGGAGTTGASLRAGKPTIIKPFFGDQYFFATRVDDLGVGMYLKKITAHQLGKALWVATHDARMRSKAAALGQSIRAEDGVQSAITALYRDLDYAKTLIKKRAQKGTATDGSEDDALSEDTEEAWTFVEKDSEADPIGSMATGGSVRVMAPR